MSEVGEIIGRLRMEPGNWFTELERADAAAHELGSNSPNIKVTASVREAVDRLGAVQGVAKRLDEKSPNIRVTASVGDAVVKLDMAAAATSRLAGAQERLRIAELQQAKAGAAAEAAEDHRWRTVQSSTASILQKTRAEQGAVRATAAAEVAGVRLEAAERGVAAARIRDADAARKQAAAAERATSANRQNGQAINIVWGGLVAVAAAAPPVAAGAIGITGALGAMGAVGILAVSGIARGMKTGQGEGVAYAGIVRGLQGDVHRLQDTAAAGLLPGAEAGVARLEQALPGIDRGVDVLAQRLGAVAPTGVDAVVTLAERGAPLFLSAADYIARMVTGLDDFSHSSAYRDFIDYSVQNLPEVERFLGQVVSTAGEFLAAWAPLGQVTLPILTDLVGALGALLHGTGPLVPAAVAVVGAFIGLKTAAGFIASATTAMRLLGITSAATAGQVGSVAAAERAVGGSAAAPATGGARGLIGGAGIATAAVAGAYFLGEGENQVAKWTGAQQSAQGYQRMSRGQALGSFLGSTSLASGGGVLGFGAKQGLKGIAAMTPWQRDALNGPLGNLAMMQGGQATANVDAVRNTNARDASLASMWKGGHSTEAVAQLRDIQAVEHLTGEETAALFPRFTALAGAIGRTGTSARVAAHQWEEMAFQQSVAAKGAQGLEGTTDAAKDAIAGMSAAVKQNGTSLSQNTVAGRANRMVMLGAVQAIQARAAALNADGKHARDAAVATDRMALSLVNSATKAGMSRTAAEALVKTLLGIPKNLSIRAKLKADDAINAAKRAKQAADAFRRGDYKTALRLENTAAMHAAVVAQEKATAFAKREYKAFLKAHPDAANASTADAARKAHAFSAAAYVATLKANPNPAIAGARAAQAAIDAVTGKTVTITTDHVGVYSDSRESNRATGGTIGSGMSSGQSIRGLAYGGTPGFTVRGAGHASSDAAGLYRLANGEEVISNLYGQADQWRPLLKGINAGKVDARTFAALGRRRGAEQPAPPARVVNVGGIHLHNPVATDPVQAAEDASQHIAAYANFPL